MNQFLKNLSGKQRLFAFVFLLSTITILLLSFSKELITTITVSIFLCIILLISRPIWLPEDYGKTRVRRYSLWVALAAFSTYGFWNYLFQEKLQAWIKSIFPDIDPSLNIPLAWGYAFLLIVILIVNYFNRDKTALKVHENPIDKDIPDPSFEERLINVVESLVDDLRSIDIKTRWSSTYFTPLDAEVELNKDNGTEKKVMDLLKAVKKSNDRIILVLGDPGAGKSVALRKLAQDLSKETSATGKIPVYINLKEWIAQNPWSIENPPTVQELNNFVFENLKNRDIVTARFFEKYYTRLYETGRLYFIFDSFDEIPAVLDEKDNSELIQSISRVLFKFLKGARSKDSQGILSSRVFRRPADDFQTKTTLFIRPFSEDKVVKTLKRTANEALIKELFVNRTDLVNIARNPFSSSLLVEYIENNPTNPLPENQARMYSDYVDRTFDTCKERIEKKNLTKSQLIECCQLMAGEMFNNFGLEVPINHLIAKYNNQPLKKVIDILVFSRIGRLGTGDNNLFSFVHRRFAEYFVIQEFAKGNIEIDLNVIPTDSQYRDALILYCEIASEEEAKKIAAFCWGEIFKVGHLLDKRAMHSLRFLKDGFKNRVECLLDFHEEFANFIFLQFSRKSNLLTISLSIEALELFHPNDKDYCINKIFNLKNYWLTEKALKSSRNLGEISPDLTRNIYLTLKKTSFKYLLKKYSQNKFSFSLSKPFEQFKSFINLKLLQYFIKFFIIGFITFSFYPYSIFAIIITIAVGFFIESQINDLDRIDKHIYRGKNQVPIFSILFPVNRVSFIEIFNYYPVGLLLSMFLIFSIPDGREISPPEKLFSFNEKRNVFYIYLFTGLSIFFLPLYQIPYFKKLYNYGLREFFIKNFIELLLFPFKFIYYIIMVPLYDFGKYFYTNGVTKNFLKWTFGIILLIIVFASMGIGMVYLKQNYDDQVVDIGLLYFLFFSMLPLILLEIKTRWSVKKEAKSIQNIVNDSISREKIYALLNSISFEENKLKFLSHIEMKKVEVYGNYPDDLFLRVSENEVNIKLAQLEEKWLGLDR